LPAATEIVAALGAQGQLVGVSHECDFPPGVRSLPRVTGTAIDPALPSSAIDRAMAEAKRAGTSPITVDLKLMAQLRPDVLIGQSVCEVCAVGEGELARVVAALMPTPWVVTLHAHTLEGAFHDIAKVGEALELRDEAEELVDGLRYRLRRVGAQLAAPQRKPRVLVLEWLDPPYVAGHWVPELVARAGGEDVGGTPGEPSRARPWRELAALAPDLVVVALCGFDVERARSELATVTDADATSLLGRRTEVIDGNAYTSRPGPRLVDAAEQLSRLMVR
ncbi:MAG TPA: ABC transporter substrate-binding protein, partial [Gemmatimonadales bacterium]|nr:ABC transporter substrate-binding protein [Gemmatimonadales bacterium]